MCVLKVLNLNLPRHFFMIFSETRLLPFNEFASDVLGIWGLVDSKMNSTGSDNIMDFAAD